MTFEIKENQDGTKFLYDEERDITFRNGDKSFLGPNRMVIDQFDLLFGTKICKLMGYQTHPVKGTDLIHDWHITVDFISKKIETPFEEIESIIKECFFIYGFGYDPDFKTNDVFCNFEGVYRA